MPPTLQLTYFGTLEVNIDGNNAEAFRSQKAQALLCFLSTSGRAHSRGSLSTLLWGESPEEQARASLRQALANLNELCEGALLLTRQSVAFNRQHPYTLDTEIFERAATSLIKNPGMLELHPALDLYQGDFLEGFTLRNAPDFDTWLLSTRAHYRQLALQAFNAVAQDCAKRDDFAAAITYTRRLIEIEPWDEAAQRDLMRLLAQKGQRHLALEQYHHLYQLLADELGIEPESATQSLYEEIKSKGSVDAPHSPGTTPLPAPLPTLGLPPVLAQDQSAPILVSSPFVGRDGEIASLMRTLEKVNAGQGQLRFVIGSAGQGKSSLVQEFLRHAQAAAPDLIALTGHCNAYTGTSDPYLPFRQMLSLLTGEVDSQSAANQNALENARRLWHALPDTLAALVHHATDLIGPFVSADTLLDRAHSRLSNHASTDLAHPWLATLRKINANPPSNPLDERRIFAQFSDLLKAIGKTRPLLLILEDLHWADVPSTSLLFHLSRTLQMASGGESAILLIATYRPTEVPTGTHPLATMLAEFKRQHGAIWLDLDAITSAEGRAFVEAYIDTEPNLLDDSFRSALFQRTGGHALFTVELMRELEARGDLYQDGDGRWMARPHIDWHTLPAKVEGVIEKQLGSLEGRALAILRAAAVQGESFTAEVVAQLLHEDERAIIFTLSQELGQKQRLVSSQEQLWIGTRRLSRYAFRHFLFQDYLYHSLDEAERVYLHEAAGNTLEQLYGEESAQIATELAYHFRQAGLLDKAITALFIAGERALALAAHQEAIQQLSQGLELLDSLPTTPSRRRQLLDYLIALASAMDVAGDFDQAEIEHILLRARDLCLQLGERGKLWSIYFGLYTTYFYRGRHHECYAMGEELLRAGEQEGEIEPTLIALLILGAEGVALGYFSLATKYMELSLILFDPILHHDLLRRYGNFEVRVEIHTGLSQGKWFSGYVDQAQKHLDAAMQVAVENNHPSVLLHALVQFTYQLEFQRRFAECAAYAERANRLANELANHVCICHSNMYAAMAMVEEGQPEAGLARLSAAIAAMRATGNTMAQGHFADLQGRALASVGRLDEAIQLIDEALAVSDVNGELFFNAELVRLRGECRQRQGAPLPEVEAHFERAILIAQEQEAKMWELRATINLCTLWQEQDKGVAAQARLAALYAWFTEGFDSPDLQAARALLATLA